MPTVKTKSGKTKRFSYDKKGRADAARERKKMSGKKKK